MTDCFALLGEPRRPWLDPESLKEKFHKLGAAHHPDVATTNEVDFSAINAAYSTLLDPKTRIRHLLELEFPGALARNLQIPPGISELFETIARDQRGITAFLQKRASLQTPLEIALLAPEKIQIVAGLERLQKALVQKQEELFAQLKSADAAWSRDKSDSVEALLEIYQSLSYVGKWLDGISGVKFQVSN